MAEFSKGKRKKKKYPAEDNWMLPNYHGLRGAILTSDGVFVTPLLVEDPLLVLRELSHVISSWTMHKKSHYNILIY